MNNHSTFAQAIFEKHCCVLPYFLEYHITNQQDAISLRSGILYLLGIGDWGIGHWALVLFYYSHHIKIKNVDYLCLATVLKVKRSQENICS
jgi:hypothetical protein